MQAAAAGQLASRLQPPGGQGLSKTHSGMQASNVARESTHCCASSLNSEAMSPWTAASQQYLWYADTPHSPGGPCPDSTTLEQLPAQMYCNTPGRKGMSEET